MKRMQVLFGRRRMMVLVTLTILVLAAAALAASSASFTATSANPGNMFTAGTLTMSNSAANTAVWNISNLKPGDTDVALGSVTIGNTGSIAGLFSLTASGLTDTPGTNGGNLSQVLDITVRDGATTVYSGDLAGFDDAAISLGTWASGATHTYSFLVTWPDGGVPGGAATGDNAYQGSRCAINLTWNASSN